MIICTMILWEALTRRVKTVPRVLFNVVVQLILADQWRATERRHQLKVCTGFGGHGTLAISCTATVQSVQEVANAGLVLGVRFDETFLTAEL